MKITNTNTNYEDRIVDKTVVKTKVNEFEETEIIQIGDKEITIIEGSGQTTVIIIAIAGSVIGLLLLGLLARYFWNKMRAETARAEQIRTTQKNLNRGEIKVIPKRGGAFEPNDSNKVGTDGIKQPNGPQGTNEEPSLGEIYEEQYDPNQEFRIFGIGDKTKGGVQSLQQKMNMADDVSGDDSSESDKGDAGPADVNPAKDQQ